MLDRTAAGDVPPKPHIALRGDAGALRYEHCITRGGFGGAFTIAYHLKRPHIHLPIETAHGWQAPEAVCELPLAKRHFRTQDLAAGSECPLDGRMPLLFNRDLTVSLVRSGAADPVYFQNGDSDDVFFVLEGGGTVRSCLGDLRFEANDYVCVPKGILHRFVPDEGVPQRWLSIECAHDFGLLSRFRNETGQLRMDAPYSHRDFRRPTFVGPVDEGIREIVIKRGGRFHGFRLEHSPLDVIGWDGSVYPWVFPILNFQPQVRSIHMPPDHHGTFSAKGALICSFVPRPVDFHPEAVSCPYPHSSVDCDEVLFYVSGSFTSRKGVGRGSLSLHPSGLPHGPHPGAYEASVGKGATTELAVMIDTWRPLHPTARSLEVQDAGYMISFA